MRLAALNVANPESANSTNLFNQMLPSLVKLSSESLSVVSVPSTVYFLFVLHLSTIFLFFLRFSFELLSLFDLLSDSNTSSSLPLLLLNFCLPSFLIRTSFFLTGRSFFKDVFLDFSIVSPKAAYNSFTMEYTLPRSKCSASSSKESLNLESRFIVFKPPTAPSTFGLSSLKLITTKGEKNKHKY